MRQVEVEHHFKNKFVGRHFFSATGEMTIFGSSREANLRLLGKGVSGIHASLQFVGSQWLLTDLGSENGTWVKKKPIISHDLNGPTTVNIGSHSLKIVPKILEQDLFVRETVANPELGFTNEKFEVFHQIVIFKNGLVIESNLLKSSQAWKFKVGKSIERFNPPKSSEWMQREFGDVTVKHRLVKSKVVEGDNREKLAGLWDPSFKTPILMSLVFLLVFSGLVLFAPTDPKDKLTELKPDKSPAVRIALDRKFRKKRMAKAKILKNKIIQKTLNPKKVRAIAKASSTKVKRARAKNRVVSRLKMSGLSKLLGRISKRASKKAHFVQRQGVTAERKNLGRSVSSIGTTGKLLDNVKKISPNYRVKNIGTAGKASGSKSYKNYGGLKTGSVGKAQVGIIEEETEIEGGLEKDVIARVIKGQLGEIRYCYERQLSASPDLYGKVLVKFTIGGSGLVSTQSLGRSTLKSSLVESCILRRVAKWKFPKPKGGTSVFVTYPFLFKSTN